MSQLEQLFTKYGTDKGTWGYTGAYEKYFAHRRDNVRKVLEIGICGYRDIPNNVVGASLFAWRDYFPNAHVIGLDNDPRFIFNDQSRIETCCCDAYVMSELVGAMEQVYRGGKFQLICDDAVHDPLPQISLLHALWPFLADDGVYAIEDVCPYKVPHGDLMMHMIRYFPPNAHVEEFTTHKDERLLIMTKR